MNPSYQSLSKYCSKCGLRLSGREKFCGNCGSEALATSDSKKSFSASILLGGILAFGKPKPDGFAALLSYIWLLGYGISALCILCWGVAYMTGHRADLDIHILEMLMFTLVIIGTLGLFLNVPLARDRSKAPRSQTIGLCLLASLIIFSLTVWQLDGSLSQGILKAQAQRQQDDLWRELDKIPQGAR